MNLSTKLTFLLLVATLAVGCNEKVAPELKNSGVTSGTPTGTVVVPEEYFFKVTSSSPASLNYQVHRTGPGNFNKECKVSSSGVALSNGLYTAEGNATPAIDADAKNFDISCFLDAEEMALYNNGMALKIEASPNTCAYIAYTPFSFYDRIPGDSTTTYTRVKCEDTLAGSAQAYIASNFGAGQVTDKNSQTVTCDQMIDNGLAATHTTQKSNTVFDTPEDETLCRFDYSKETVIEGIEPGANCDVGIITIKDILVTTTINPITGNPQLSSTSSTSTIKCGGKIGNCVKGPANDIKPGYATASAIIANTLNEAFTKEFSYAAPIDKNRQGNFYLANYRSTLANPDLDYQDYEVDSFQSVWSLDSNRKKFNADVMQYYSANRFYKTNTRLIKTNINTDNLTALSDWDQASVTQGYTARPYAADPFMGINLGNNTGNTTQPFYTITCLDSAMDIRGRIRLSVREWDRTFTSSAALENLSDFIGNTTTPNLVSRQDNPVEQEIPNDPGLYNSFNDQWDWDNLIPMTRTTGPTTLGVTKWNPERSLIMYEPNAADLARDARYPSGFFNPIIFTRGGI